MQGTFSLIAFIIMCGNNSVNVFVHGKQIRLIPVPVTEHSKHKKFHLLIKHMGIITAFIAESESCTVPAHCHWFGERNTRKIDS